MSAEARGGPRRPEEARGGLRRPEEGIESTGAGVTDAVSFLLSVLGTKLWSPGRAALPSLSHLRSLFVILLVRLVCVLSLLRQVSWRLT